MQETFLAAWRGLEGFEGRASVRTWLYRIATNRCLNALRDASRRPGGAPALPPNRPEPTRVGDPLWLQPYPDALLDGVADDAPGPDQRYESREAVALAFVAGLQHLPPTQRALLVLRDVLGFRAAEAAEMLDLSEATVNSGLQRARSALETRLPSAGRERAPLPRSAGERELVGRFADAFESGDVDTIVSLLTDDAWLTMPPVPLEYQGRERSGGFCRRCPPAAGSSASAWWPRAPTASPPSASTSRTRNAPSRTRPASWCSRSRGIASRRSRRSTTPPSSPGSGCRGRCLRVALEPAHDAVDRLVRRAHGEPDEVEVVARDRAHRGAVVVVLAGREQVGGVDRETELALLSPRARRPSAASPPMTRTRAPAGRASAGSARPDASS